jgi:hypothetical protein
MGGKTPDVSPGKVARISVAAGLIGLENDMVQALPKLAKVEALDTGRVLRFKLKNAEWREVDLAGFISRFRGLAALQDERVFAKAKVTDWGAAVGWPGDIGIAAATLLRAADEQRPFAAPDFAQWQERMKLSNQETADALGVSLNTIKNWRRGREIPVAAAIACRMMESEPTLLAAHFRPRKTGRPKAA